MACCRVRKRTLWSDVSATAGHLLADALRFLSLGLRSRSRLAAENLFLRKQLALYVERRVKTRRTTDATRITLVVLARFINWKATLIVVKPKTLIRWHRRVSACSGGGSRRHVADRDSRSRYRS